MPAFPELQLGTFFPKNIRPDFSDIPDDESGEKGFDNSNSHVRRNDQGETEGPGMKTG
jgi:hypothetical protein